MIYTIKKHRKMMKSFDKKIWLCQNKNVIKCRNFKRRKGNNSEKQIIQNNAINVNNEYNYSDNNYTYNI